MFKIALFAAAALLSSPAMAQPTQEKITVIADNSEVCGPIRLAYRKAAENERVARKLAMKLEREGASVDVVVLNPGQQIGTFNRRSSAPSQIVLHNPC